MAEAALPGFDVTPWIAVAAPHGTPPEAIKTLNSTIYKVMSDPKIQQTMVDLACNPVPTMSTGEVAAFIRKEGPIWGQRVRDAHLEVQ